MRAHSYVQIMQRLGQMKHNVGHNRPTFRFHGSKSKNHSDQTFKKTLQSNLKSPKTELFHKVFDMSEHIQNQNKKQGSTNQRYMAAILPVYGNMNPSNFMSPSKPTLKSQIQKRGSLEWMKTLQNLALEEFAIADSLRPMNLQGQRMLLDRPLPMF